MPTYLLTWNPERWPWEDLQEYIDEINVSGHTSITWSCSHVKQIREGDRVFMIRLGSEPRGIFASGKAISNVYEKAHWNRNAKGKPCRYIDIQLELLLNPLNEPILFRSELDRGILKNMQWNSRFSGRTIPSEIAIELERKWSELLQFKNIDNSRDGLKLKEYNSELSTEIQKLEIEGYFEAETLEDSRERVLSSIVRRQGQSEFRQKLLNIYNGRCPITGCDAEPALEAAHIIPYKGTATNHPANGLLLRADLHTLFDLHLVSICPETYEIMIAPDLTKTCYKELIGKKLAIPERESEIPDKKALDEHYGTFLQKNNVRERFFFP